MRILHVHDFFAPGNSRYGFDMDRLLAARGHELHVLAGVGERGPGDGASLEGVRFHTYPYRADLSAWGRYRYAKRTNAERFEALHGAHAFDLVLLNQPLCAAGVLSTPSSRNVARVYVFISPWAGEWAASNPGAGFLSRTLHAGFRNRIEDRAVRDCHRVIVESEFIRTQFNERHPGVPPGRVALLPGAVDLGRFSPDGSRESNRARFGLGAGPVVLTVRRLVERMGIDLLLRAAAQVGGLEVVVGGDGPLRADLEALARSLGVRARFLGFVPDEDLPALYRAADLFVLPTRELEGFGLVAIEAMACGTPAMGTPVGAIPEVLGSLGLVFRECTPDAIAEGLRTFFGSRDASLADRCRREVELNYDWARVIERLEQVLLEVCRESAGHGRA
jgi:glycosyltransferase involved in cell wall biosynthesis